MNSQFLSNLLIIVAVCAIVGGISWVSLPAGVITGGVVMYIVGIRLAVKGSGDESG